MISWEKVGFFFFHNIESSKEFLDNIKWKREVIYNPLANMYWESTMPDTISATNDMKMFVPCSPEACSLGGNIDVLISY
jgi:hypothetical protein